MKWMAVLLVVVGTAWEGRAHRLDECLQAARIRVERGRLDVSIDVTPGVAVADLVLTGIDQDQDGRISEEEEKAYAKVVIRDVNISLDGEPFSLKLRRVRASPLYELQQGLGAIRIQAQAEFKPLTEGPHRLNLTNNHLPDISVHLVNALEPDGEEIVITGQDRDRSQRSYNLCFEVRADGESREP